MNILVTGGASGLGASITKALASNENYQVYFTYNKSEAAALSITREYKNSHALKCNFQDIASLQNFIDNLKEINPDVLINNAITGFEVKHFHKFQEDVFINSFQNNVLPVLKLSQECIRIFRKKKFGKIITILSSAIVGKPPIGWSEYVANKVYLLSMSKSWAIENASFNITSNCISPAFLETSLTSNTDERIKEDMLARHPLKKFLTPDEVADTVAFLVGASQHINGTNILINSASDVI